MQGILETLCFEPNKEEAQCSACVFQDVLFPAFFLLFILSVSLGL